MVKLSLAYLASIAGCLMLGGMIDPDIGLGLGALASFAGCAMIGAHFARLQV